MISDRLIEELFPIKECSEYTIQENNVRSGHIRNLHIWWARRPLAPSRTTAYAALIPAPETEKELEEEQKFIAEFSKWENINNPKYLTKAKINILRANNGKSPKILDPFGGGGSIPLECLRLGCETHSNDLNPVAVLIQKCTLEYPQIFGKPGFLNREINEFGKKKNIKLKVDNVLMEDVKYWCDFVYEEVKAKLNIYYPSDTTGYSPICYLWVNTLSCQNPACKVEIPLLKDFWVSKKSNNPIAVIPYYQHNLLSFELLDSNPKIKNSKINLDNGTISRSIVKCIHCGAVIDAKTTRKLFLEGKTSRKLYLVILENGKSGQRKYRLSNETDMEVFNKTSNELTKLYIELEKIYGINFEFNETLPLMSGVFNVPLYGINTWGKLYNSRQLLTLIYFIKVIKNTYLKHLTKYENEYAKAILSYIVFGLDKLAPNLTVLTRWRNDTTSVERIFDKQALPMIFSFAEVNPFSNSRGSWEVNSILSSIKFLSQLEFPAHTYQFSATSLPFDDNSFDAIFTDPPYYNSVPYADLSDFFYVIQKRVLADVFPELYTSPLTPKKAEITEMSGWDSVRYPEKDKAFFESNLQKSFIEIFRVLKPNGIAIIVYAHKTTAGWETLINSLIQSNLVVTAAYPINTEISTRARAQESAALASSIYIVCRKTNRNPVILYNDAKEELKHFLHLKLDRLWNQGIGGADFFISAIGSSLEVFGKYLKVIDFEGREVKADKFLQDVRVIVTDYAVKKILHNGFANEISDLTRFYVLFRWEFGTLKVEFDEANKLAHSCHIDLADEWTKKTSFIKKDKEFISILSPQDRDIEDLEESAELIDVLHLSLKYWEKNRKAELNTLLRVSGFGKSDSFFRVAQAIIETFPPESKEKEKQLLEGFLNLREKIISTVSEPKTKYDQGKLEFPENE